MTEEEFRERFRKSPIKRAKRRGLLRNVAVALGNWGSKEVVPALMAALEDEEPLVRGARGVGAGADRGADTRAALAGRLEREEDAGVRAEIAAASCG
jgi:epoxyqueuosine reductase